MKETNVELLDRKKIRKREIQGIAKHINLVIMPKNGYGSCKSCNCKGWVPNHPKNDYCKNCGHHWSQHW